uniref:Uncharacterized protein n=1 Tax=Caenorhabditis japonica TaxID=281687 RepID=A0A8R1I6N0_CAEJA
MPPRKIKRDPDAAVITETIEKPVLALFDGLEAKLYEIAELAAKQQTERFLAMIPPNVRKMSLAEYLHGPPFELFAESPAENKIVEQNDHEAEKETDEEIENEAENQKNTAENASNMEVDEVDDVARDMSIPLANSGQNSARSTATESTLRELITPAGHSIPIPHTIHPKIDIHKKMRFPRVDEEIAFSVNGSPMVLMTTSGGQRKSRVRTGDLRVPKMEDPGTPV